MTRKKYMTTSSDKTSAPWDRIFEDYKPDALKDDEFLYNCKKALMALPEPDRNLLIRYAEEGTYAAVAKRYHCSTPTVKYKIDDIRKKIFGYGS